MTHRQVTLVDEKVEQTRYQRIHLVPSYATAAPGQAEAFEVLSFLLGGGQTSILFKRLVMQDKIAVAAGTHYMGAALDETRFFVYAMPVPGVSLETLDTAIEAIFREMAREGFDPKDVERAKTRLIAEAIYARDSQMTLANWYGSSLTTGLTLRDIEEWPARVEAVTPEALRDALKLLARKHGVSGYLMQAEAEAA